jgi:hypothetical protein
MTPTERSYLANTADLIKAIRLLKRLSGDDAERLALDMDHRCKDHARWYRAVKAARKFLKP